MKIERFSMGPMAANCYILLDEASGEAAVIDPGAHGCAPGARASSR